MPADQSDHDAIGRVIPLDRTCPYCRRDTQVDGEFFDGSEFRCANCGKRVVTYYVIGRGERDEWIVGAGEITPSSFETGRQRTRRVWRRRGRR